MINLKINVNGFVFVFVIKVYFYGSLDKLYLKKEVIK